MVHLFFGRLRPWDKTPSDPHAFRHTQASLQFFNGIDSLSISHRLGHAMYPLPRIFIAMKRSFIGIKEAEERISDCIADVILRPVKTKLKVVGD